MPKAAGYKQTKIRRSVISHVRDEPSPADLAARLAERDARYDADDRTPAEQWLNDPPRWRSALGTAALAKPLAPTGQRGSFQRSCIFGRCLRHDGKA